MKSKHMTTVKLHNMLKAYEDGEDTREDFITSLYKEMRNLNKTKNDIFVEHIERHLKEKHLKNVVCKICGKTIEQIYKEEGGE